MAANEDFIRMNAEARRAAVMRQDMDAIVACDDQFDVVVRLGEFAETHGLTASVARDLYRVATHDLRPSYPRASDFASLASTNEERSIARLSPRCIVENYLYADVALLSAQGGTGKTTLTLWEAIHIVLGLPLYGHQVVCPGPVLLITAEDTREILLARLNRIMAAMELSDLQVAKIDRDLLIWDVTGSVCRLVEVSSSGGLNLTGFADSIADAAVAINPAMIVIDPIISFGPGESRVNDVEQMFIHAARRIVSRVNCCVRFITHVSQAAATSKTEGQYASRGGTALPDGSRMVAVLNHADADKVPKVLGDCDRALKLTRPKLSYSVPQPAVYLVRDEWTFNWAQEIPVDPEVEERAISDQVENYLVSKLGEGAYFTRDNLKHKPPPGLTRIDVQHALSDLEARGRVVDCDLPASERKGKRKTYLHPTRVPFGRDSSE